MSNSEKDTSLWASPIFRANVAVVGPLLGAWLIAGGSGTAVNTTLFFGALGLLSWLLGLGWVGLPGMGLRGQRPLFAGIGFSVLGWVAMLLFRFVFVQLLGFGSPDSGRVFFYLLIFEAFCVQLWAFGLVFHTVAHWRGPLSAAVLSGMLFGFVALLFFQESYLAGTASLISFLLWGILYGLIRLRTGSILGVVVVQALQSFTAWSVLRAPTPPDGMQLQSLYLAVSLSYLVIIWRLWPKVENDYRV